ncbi:hypothetical protein E2C01_035651 [Portunus trituberculatus]|uniref:Uncharacterized protein n=1 Tax=Portunus trituberculatus TaxID=210409 RepID=A0A5B7F9X5_PORTR|nr:hypothetical protein [Portunus trituberculatus]
MPTVCLSSQHSCDNNKVPRSVMQNTPIDLQQSLKSTRMARQPPSHAGQDSNVTPGSSDRPSVEGSSIAQWKAQSKISNDA